MRGELELQAAVVRAQLNYRQIIRAGSLNLNDDNYDETGKLQKRKHNVELAVTLQKNRRSAGS